MRADSGDGAAGVVDPRADEGPSVFAAARTDGAAPPPALTPEAVRRRLVRGTLVRGTR